MSEVADGGGNQGGVSGEASSEVSSGASSVAPVASVSDALGGPPPVSASGDGDSSVSAPEWAPGISGDDLAFLTNKGLDKEGKGLIDLVQIARHQDSLKGVPADQLARIPDFSKPDQVSEFNQKMGVPADPGGYEPIEIPIGDGALDTTILAEMSHKAHLRPDQHAVLAEAIGEWANANDQMQIDERSAANGASQVELAKSWGDKFDVNTAVVDRVASMMGITGEEFAAIADAIGPHRAGEAFLSAGEKLGEHRPGIDSESSNQTGIGLGKDAAIQRREQLKGDRAFFKRMETGDRAALEEWKNINHIASS